MSTYNCRIHMEKNKFNTLKMFYLDEKMLIKSVEKFFNLHWRSANYLIPLEN